MTRLLLLAAFAATGLVPAESVRLGNEAARAGSPDAERHYDAAEERGDDPGLVAFNRAAFHFARDEFREAELDYLRCLEDGAIPAERRRQALYNRGVCLVRRDGDARLYRAAIRCFEDCLNGADSDDDLAKNSRLNLELAKVLWNRERSKDKDPPSPNERDPDERPKPMPMSQRDPGGEEPGTGDERTPSNATANGGKTETRPNRTPTTKESPRPGKGTEPVVRDDAAVNRLTPEDTRAILDRTEARLRAARQQNELMRAGPERPNVRDW